MRGMDSDVSGIFSAMASMKTEKASRTVIPRPIFSPESGGRQRRCYKTFFFVCPNQWVETNPSNIHICPMDIRFAA